MSGVRTDNIDRLLGVVVRSDDSPITITSDTEGVFVATSGKHEILVSNQNEVIQSGDYITGSALTGIGMKADARQEFIVGTALQDLDLTDGANILSTTQITDNEGVLRDIAIGKILIEVDVQENPLSRNVLEKAPDFIINIGEAIAGKPISPIRFYAGVAILLISFSLAGSMLYASVKSSIISIGRNPLSRSTVFRSLLQVIAVSIAIFLLGIFGVYLILRL